jgi:hypothetical protein
VVDGDGARMRGRRADRRAGTGTEGWLGRGDGGRMRGRRADRRAGTGTEGWSEGWSTDGGLVDALTGTAVAKGAR